ncbi:hypothetical protein AAC387_Pa02g4344 [Persea americana]
MSRRSSDEELMQTLGDFTSRENWDKFFTLRDADHPFEWYAEWATLRDPLISALSSLPSPKPLQILVPGCGNSQLSEQLYDAGFRHLTNIDFSKVVVSDMLRRHVRSRAEMRWRVMDMTQMQFADEFFDAILDKGGLDALMEPEHGPKLGCQYISEVKRVLKTGGKYVCLTLAESHVLDVLFSEFRFGWKTNIHNLPHKPSNMPGFQTFMVVIAKESSSTLEPIVASFDLSSVDCSGNQGRGVLQALEVENKLRSEWSSGADILSSIKDLQLGTKGDLKELIPGRRVQLMLGENGDSHFRYKAILLDSQQQSGQFMYRCAVFLVHKTRAHEWLFSSEEGQWVVVESSKAARLIMVFLDSVHIRASMDDIQKDLSPLVRSLAPGKLDDGAQFPFMIDNDGVKERNIVQQVTSSVTGNIIVEDVIYENVNDHGNDPFPPKDSMFRRLTFERSLGLVQSEALVSKEGSSQKGFRDPGRRKNISKSKRRSQRKTNSHMPVALESGNNLKIDHSFLASSYHSGIVAGFMLIASNLETVALSGRTLKTIIIGLGAGLLPMFLHRSMPFLDIEVVELDPVILDLAKDHFGFAEDGKLKVHVADGIHFVREVANSAKSSKIMASGEVSFKECLSSVNGRGIDSIPKGKKSNKIDILIIDADSSDVSSGLTCPPSDFTEESFLLSVRESLSESGLFVINLVSRSTALREMIVSRMKVVFSQLFYLELEEDVNKVLFALPTEACVAEEECLSEAAAVQLEKLLKLTYPERGPNIIETAKKIERL